MAGFEDQAQRPLEPDQIAETSKESIGKLKSLVDGLKSVEEHEKGILGEFGRE